MLSSFTAAQVIDMARMRSQRFAELTAPDGALLLALDARQRTLLLQYGAAVEGLYNTTAQIATTINGTLVGVDADGVPQFLTTYQDGWPIHFTDDGVPYSNLDEAPIAGDPFGERGGVPGFPLPDDFLKVINALVVYASGRVVAIEIVGESARTESLRANVPSAFISGNRIVPIRPLVANNSGDIWAGPITAIQLSYVAFPHITSMTDRLTLPAALLEPLIAGLADAMAAMLPTVTASEAARLAAATSKAEQAIEDFSVDVVGAMSPQRVTYRR